MSSTDVEAPRTHSRLTQWIIAIIVSGAGMGTGQGTTWPMAALPKIQRGEAGIVLNTEELSWAVSIVFAGSILGSLQSAYIMDWLGRKTALLLFNGWAVVGWFLLYFTTSAWSMYLARVLMGFWAGAAYSVVPIYLGETVDAGIRGSATSLLAVFLYIGTLYESLIGPYLTYDQLNLASAAIPTIYCFSLLWIPESPYYQLMKGKKDEAEKTLVRLRGPRGVEDMGIISEKVTEQMKNPGSVVEMLKSPGSRKAFIIVQVLRSVQRTSGQVILSAYASIAIPASFISPESSGTVLCVVWLCSSLLGIWTVDHFGRKPMTLLSCFGVFLTMSAVTAWYFLRDQTEVDVTGTEWLPLVALIMHGLSYAMGMVSVPSVVQGELFPVNVKAKASAITTIVTAIVSLTVGKIFLPINESLGLYFNFLICAVTDLLGMIFFVFYMFETKGKTLEEIQDMLTNKKV